MRSTHCSHSTFRSWHRCLIRSWCQFASKSFSKSTQVKSKLDLQRCRLFDRISHRSFIDCFTIWDATLKPCRPLRRAQDASKMAPETGTRRTTRRVPLRRRFPSLVSQFKLKCWYIFDRVWIDVLIRVWSILGRCLDFVLMLFYQSMSMDVNAHTSSFIALVQARWRIRSFAALSIRFTIHN